MTPWNLLQTSEAAQTIAFWAVLLGLTCGIGAVCLVVGWRVLTYPAALREETRMLRRQLEDAHQQIRHLYGQLDRLARLACERVGRPATARKSEVA